MNHASLLKYRAQHSIVISLRVRDTTRQLPVPADPRAHGRHVSIKLMLVKPDLGTVLSMLGVSGGAGCGYAEDIHLSDWWAMNNVTSKF